MFEVFTTGGHNFTYTYETKSDKILILALHFSSPTLVSTNTRKPDKVTINIKEPYLFIAKGIEDI